MVQFVHSVLMKVSPSTEEDAIDKLYVALKGLKDKIPGLLEFSGGPYDSPEGLNKEFTHAFSMVFASREDRDAYFPHPEHEIVKMMVLAVVDDVIAFDYAK